MSGETKVDWGSLPGQAQTWSQQATAIGNISGTISGLQIPASVPWFQDAVNAYNQVCQLYEKLSGQGFQQMQSIANALTTAYQNYQSTEQHLTQSAGNVGH
ncbi:MAG TPA: hypothetical protein VGI74_09265 [Streptosporangiaceae bacterium]|jgi:hypothetical protein